MSPEEEFNLYDEQKSWAAMYQKIHSDALKNHSYSLKDARRPEYKNRNRYGDVSPYDHSRVKLERNDVDYINASLVESTDVNRAYILTQGPLPETAGHFWLMVWEQNSRAILMLNRIVEKGQIKCFQYYPTGQDNEDDDEKVFNDVGLKVTYVTELDSNYHYTARVFQIHDLKSMEMKQVIQFHYTAWPDFGVPESPDAFLDFLFAVRKSGVLDNPVCPPVIHCSAGIGRSGTFCLVDTCLVLIEKYGEMNGMNVIDILMEMRRYRMGLIQTPHQLRFSYQAIIEGKSRIRPMSSHGESTLNTTTEEEIDSNELITCPEDHDDSSTEFETYGDDESLPNTPPPIPPRVGTAAPKDEFTLPSHNNHDKNTIINGSLNKTELETATNVNEIRRRTREERIKSTAEQIARMKQHQKESELWHSRQKKLKPYFIGLLTVLAVGGYVLYRYYWT